MEVHHPHELHHKKKWTGYLLEFFMLFLAVFLGFIAENIREGIVERHSEKGYIRSMVEDLKTDTTKLGLIIERYESKMVKQDSFIKIFHLIDKGYNRAIENNISGFLGYSEFIYTDGTIQQLKNSGGFRLIRNHKVADSIMSYEQEVRKALNNENELGSSMGKLIEHLNVLFDYRVLDDALREGKTASQLEQEKFDYLFLHDSITLDRFYNMTRLYRTLTNIVVKNMMVVKAKAARLISFYRKEYHLVGEQPLATDKSKIQH